MSDFFEMLEKYRFGLLAALLAYVLIFAYFQIGTYNGGSGIPYEPFPEGPRLEIPEDEIELKAENIKVPSDFNPSDIKNTARDANDKRDRSEKDYSVSKSSGELSAEEYEKKLFEEAGGAKTREEIRQQMAERQKQEKKRSETKSSTSNNQSTSGTRSAAAGNVMVEFSVPNHTAHQGNDYYVRNPGYKCGEGSSGTVMVLVKVDQSGNVLSAEYDPSQSRGNITQCMITEAKKYALISRFNYSAKAAKSQSGWISYTFVSQ